MTTRGPARPAPEADILVAGGGTAGTAAAIAAARRGHRVLLVEQSNALGGTSTTGGVCAWFASLEGLGDIFDAVRRELERYGGLTRPEWRAPGERGDTFFNPEVLKIVWQRLAEEAGVRLLFHASAVGAETEGRRVRRVRVAASGHLIEAEARYFIDATGEGDLAAAAGASFERGHPETGQTLHMSLIFTLYDTGRPVTPYLPDGLEPIRRKEDLPGLNVAARLTDGRVFCNMVKVMHHDPADPFSLSGAEREARRQIARLVHFLQRTRYPTYALASSGAHIGVREGRRIVGDYVLTADDIRGREPKDFPDGVAVATSQIDFHSLTRPGHGGWREAVAPYAIPFRCLVARDLDNLLMAGKCISGGQVAMSSYRMTPTCCAMGQAAGTAAALAVESGRDEIRRIDVARLRRVLSEDGMELDPRRHAPFAPEVSGGPEDRL